MKRCAYTGPSDRRRVHGYPRVPYLHPDAPVDLPNDVAAQFEGVPTVTVTDPDDEENEDG